MHNLPKWLQQACQDQVITRKQALHLDRLIQAGETRLPKRLHKAAERLFLWRLPASPTQH